MTRFGVKGITDYAEGRYNIPKIGLMGNMAFDMVCYLMKLPVNKSTGW
ncbi:MAG: hypothetical protein VXY77_02280 [Pseudomonadota bacterium]|nr:hypothetical protein [Pseudomonadota bacterium]